MCCASRHLQPLWLGTHLGLGLCRGRRRAHACVAMSGPCTRSLTAMPSPAGRPDVLDVGSNHHRRPRCSDALQPLRHPVVLHADFVELPSADLHVVVLPRSPRRATPVHPSPTDRHHTPRSISPSLRSDARRDAALRCSDTAPQPLLASACCSSRRHPQPLLASACCSRCLFWLSPATPLHAYPSCAHDPRFQHVHDERFPLQAACRVRM